MRELTESILRFYWAASLLGIEQTTNLLARYNGTKAENALDQVTEAASAQLNPYLESLFEIGDKLQKTAFDLGLGVFDPAKTIVRFYWAASLLGINKTTDLLAQWKSAQGDKGLDQVTDVATGLLGPYMESLFQKGDGLQTALLDLGFGVLDPANWDLSRFAPGPKCVNYGEEWGPVHQMD